MFNNGEIRAAVKMQVGTDEKQKKKSLNSGLIVII